MGRATTLPSRRASRVLEEEIAQLRKVLRAGLQCASCGHLNRSGARFCSQCGEALAGSGRSERGRATWGGGVKLAARGLVCDYGPTRALDGVDVDADSGSILAIFGPNGAGKTTLLRALSGERRPDRGEVLLDGAAVLGSDPAWRSRVGLVSHRTGLYRKLTVGENLDFFAALHGLSRDPDRAGPGARRGGGAGVGGHDRRGSLAGAAATSGAGPVARFGSRRAFPGRTLHGARSCGGRDARGDARGPQGRRDDRAAGHARSEARAGAGRPDRDAAAGSEGAGRQGGGLRGPRICCHSSRRAGAGRRETPCAGSD